MNTPAQPAADNLPVVPGNTARLIELTPESINRVLHNFGVTGAERTQHTDGSEGEFKDFPRKAAWQSLSGQIAEQVGEPAQNQRRQANEVSVLAEIDVGLDHLEDALLAFLHGPRPGQADVSQEGGDPAPDMLAVCLSLLEELRKEFFTAAIPAHHRFLDFPRFFALAIEIMQAGIAAGYVGRDGVAFAMPFLEHTRSYLVAVMEHAFHERYQEVGWRLGGAHSELAYIYDERRRESLTEWVELNSDTAPDLQTAALFLKEAVARAYVNALPLTMAFQALAAVLLELDDQSVERYKSDILPPVRSEAAAISRLLLPAVIARYCPAARRHRNARVFDRELVKKLSTDVTSRMTMTFVSTMGKSRLFMYASTAIGGTFVGALAPVILLLVEMLWPGESSVTLSQVQAEVDKRIADALGKQERDQINNILETVGNNYEKTFIIFNSKPAAKTRIESWLRLLEGMQELEVALCTPSNDIYYEIYPYFAMFMEMRQNVLSAAMLCAAEDEELNDEGKDAMIETLLEDTKEFYNRCYSYLENLATSSFNYIRNSHIDVDSWYTFPASRGNQAFDDLSGHRYSKVMQTWARSDANWHVAKAVAQMPEGRARLFAALNTGIHNLCLQYDAAVTEINKSNLLSKKFPTATDTVFHNILVDEYARFVTQSHERAKALGSGVEWPIIWYNADVFGTNGWHKDNPTTYDALIDISYRDSAGISMGGLSIGPGDYPDLWMLMDNNGCDMTRHGYFHFSIPYGMRVDLYLEKGWKGMITRFPLNLDDNRDQTNMWQVHNYCKSMKIYIDMPCYFETQSMSHFTNDIAHRKEGIPLLVKRD